MWTREKIATSIAIVFHAIGLVGILFYDREVFASTTPFHLLLMFFLLLYTQKHLTVGMFLFTIACIVIGFVVEWIGVRTGLLFGSYSYGKPLGPAISGVPMVIGINWFLIIYTAGVSIHMLLNKIVERLSIMENAAPRKSIKLLSVMVDGASLATLMDWLIEPVAIKLGYWNWTDGEIPFFNYVCWFLVSLLLLTIFHYCRFPKQNKFAVNLLLIQAMFFLVLRTFL